MLAAVKNDKESVSVEAATKVMHLVYELQVAFQSYHIFSKYDNYTALRPMRINTLAIEYGHGPNRSASDAIPDTAQGRDLHSR